MTMHSLTIVLVLYVFYGHFLLRGYFAESTNFNLKTTHQNPLTKRKANVGNGGYFPSNIHNGGVDAPNFDQLRPQFTNQYSQLPLLQYKDLISRRGANTDKGNNSETVRTWNPNKSQEQGEKQKINSDSNTDSDQTIKRRTSDNDTATIEEKNTTSAPSTSRRNQDEKNLEQLEEQLSEKSDAIDMNKTRSETTGRRQINSNPYDPLSSTGKKYKINIELNIPTKKNEFQSSSPIPGAFYNSIPNTPVTRPRAINYQPFLPPFSNQIGSDSSKFTPQNYQMENIGNNLQNSKYWPKFNNMIPLRDNPINSFNRKFNKPFASPIRNDLLNQHSESTYLLPKRDDKPYQYPSLFNMNQNLDNQKITHTCRSSSTTPENDTASDIRLINSIIAGSDYKEPTLWDFDITHHKTADMNAFDGITSKYHVFNVPPDYLQRMNTINYIEASNPTLGNGFSNIPNEFRSRRQTGMFTASQLPSESYANTVNYYSPIKDFSNLFPLSQSPTFNKLIPPESNLFSNYPYVYPNLYYNAPAF